MVFLVLTYNTDGDPASSLCLFYPRTTARRHPPLSLYINKESFSTRVHPRPARLLARKYYEQTASLYPRGKERRDLETELLSFPSGAQTLPPAQSPANPIDETAFIAPSTDYRKSQPRIIINQSIDYRSSQHFATEKVVGSSSQQTPRNVARSASIFLVHFAQARSPNEGGLSTSLSLSPIIASWNFVTASVLRSMDLVPTFRTHALSGQTGRRFAL